ncbi:MAG: response regulator [Lentisphaerota bacterium]
MKILMVEDDKISRIRLQTILRSGGYEVLSACNGKEALTLTRKDRPDLVISDILMPEMDGYTLCRMLKSDPKTAPIPFIFISVTYTSERDRQFAMDLGAARFLIKPMDRRDLLTQIQETLAQNISTEGSLPLAPLKQLSLAAQQTTLISRKLDKKTNELTGTITQLDTTIKQLEVANHKLEHELTEHKRAVAALRKSEERFNLIAKQSQVMIWEVNLEGLYTYVSSRASTLLGYRPDGIVGIKHFYDLHPADGREAFKQRAFASFAREEPFLNLLHPVETKDGRIIWLSTNGTPLLDTHNVLQGYCGSDSDTTESKQAEDKVKQQLDELHRWHNVTRGREGRIAELKREVNELSLRVGEKPRYEGSEEEEEEEEEDNRAGVYGMKREPRNDAGESAPGEIKPVEHNLTTRKRKEENLRRFATVVRDSNDAITIQDFEGWITA